AVPGPGERHMSRAGEAGEFVDVTAGFIEIYALPQPDHAADAQIAAQLFLDLGTGEPGIAIRIEQALFGGQTGALPIHVDGAALEHEGRPVAIGTFDLQHLLRDLVIAIPGEVQTAVETAPGVESPIDASP